MISYFFISFNFFADMDELMDFTCGLYETRFLLLFDFFNLTKLTVF